MEPLDNYAKAFEAYLRSLNKSFYTIKQYTLDAKQFAEIVATIESADEALKQYTKIIGERYKNTSSINRKYAAIRQFLDFLQTRGILSSYNKELIQPLEKDAKKLDVLTDAQLKRALTFWPHKYDIALNDEDSWLAIRNATIVFTIAELGIKPAELVRMEWKHIREEEKQLLVLASKKFRLVDMSTKLIELLERYQEETIAWMPVAEVSPFVWLGVGNQKGQAITVKTIERIFFAMSEQLGFKITATNLRYHVIHKELRTTVDTDALFEQFGYARKGVLIERQQRFGPSNE